MFFVLFIVIIVTVVVVDTLRSRPASPDSGSAGTRPASGLDQRANPGNYDASYFTTPRGAFCFPKYSASAGWVSIIDKTKYQDFLDNHDPKEKRAYGLAELVQDAAGALKFDVTPFWGALERATKEDLGDDADIVGDSHTYRNIHTLRNMWYAYMDDDDHDKSGDRRSTFERIEPNLEAALNRRGLIEACDLGEEHASTALALKTTEQLRDIAAEHGLDTAGTKSELERRLYDNVPLKALIEPRPAYRAKAGFRDLIASLSTKYLDHIAGQVAGWHPLWVDAVWKSVADVNRDVTPPGLAKRVAAARAELRRVTAMTSE